MLSRITSPMAGSSASCPPRKRSQKRRNLKSPLQPLPRSSKDEMKSASSEDKSCGGKVVFPIRAFSPFVTLVLFLCGCSQSSKITELKFFPPEIHLSSAKTHQNLVVQASYADGITRDVTSQATFWLVNPKLARLDHATLSPVADGKTELRVTF